MAYKLWSTPDIAGVLAGLAHVAAQMPESTYRNGYMAALEAAALALGTVERQREAEQQRTPAPGVFHDLTHESVPFPFAAFTRLGL